MIGFIALGTEGAGHDNRKTAAVFRMRLSRYALPGYATPFIGIDR
jgi:hypothetical protein